MVVMHVVPVRPPGINNCHSNKSGVDAEETVARNPVLLKCKLHLTALIVGVNLVQVLEIFCNEVGVGNFPSGFVWWCKFFYFATYGTPGF